MAHRLNRGRPRSEGTFRRWPLAAGAIAVTALGVALVVPASAQDDGPPDTTTSVAVDATTPENATSTSTDATSNSIDGTSPEEVETTPTTEPSERPLVEVPAATDGKVTATVTVADATVRLRLFPPDDAPVPGVSISAGPLTVQGRTLSADTSIEVDGQAYQPGSTFDVPRKGAEVVLDATLPAIGTYETILVVEAADRDLRIPITVEYGTKPTFALDAPPTVAAGTWFDVSLRATGTDGATDARLLLTSLRQTRSGPVNQGADATLETQRCSVEDRCTRQTPGTVIAIPKGETVQLRLRVTGISDPGTYTASLRVEAVGTDAEATAPFDITQRWTIWAAFWILLSAVAVAEAIRRIVSVTRPRLAARAAVADWSSNLQLTTATLPADLRLRPDVLAVVAQIERDLVAVDARAASGRVDTAKVDELLAPLDGRIRMLPRWASLVAAAEAAGVLDDVRSEVAEVADFIGLGVGTSEEADAALGHLRERAAAGLAKREAQRLVDHLSAATVRVPSESQVETDGALALAQTAVTKLSEKAFDAARTAYDQARESWDREVIAMVARWATPVAPLGNGGNAWNELREAATNRIDEQFSLGQAEKDLNGLFSRYGRYVLTAATEFTARAEATANDSAEAKANKEAFHGAVRDLQVAVNRGNGPEIAKRSETLISAAKALKATGGLKRLGGTAPVVSMANAPSVDRAAFTIMGRTATPPRELSGATIALPDAAALASTLRGLDIAVGAIAALISVAFGLLVIYEPSASWGGASDALTLFAWGVGIHEISGVTAAATVRKKVVDGLPG